MIEGLAEKHSCCGAETKRCDRHLTENTLALGIEQEKILVKTHRAGEIYIL
jgi:hypothetical protein